MLLALFIFFIFGAIVGSFLNVVVLRYNTSLSFMKGRSKCFSCGKKLEWFELVPLLSFIFLKGKCSECKSKISFRYFLVEFLTGLIFSLIFWKVSLSLILPFYLLVASILIAISFYDLMHKIIPDGMVIFFNAFSLFILFFNHGFHNAFKIPGLMDFLSGFILFGFFALFWLVSLGRWMGFGDAKLALGVGWLLGFSGGIFSIILAFWIGAIWSIIMLLLQKLNIFRLHLTIKSEVPFAPFIIIALGIQFFTGWNFASLINFLN